MNLVVTDKLSKNYHRGSETVHALQEASLTVKQGELISLVGPSGSGKTTFMNLLGCLDTPSSGSYLLNGQEVAGLQESQLVKVRQQNIGFVFQQFFLLPTLTVKENVELPLLFNPTGKSRALDLLEIVGLSSRRNHLPRELSGGEMQRVAIARALINSPKILLADEPTGNLDSKNSEKVMSLFNDLHRQGLTVILVTHNMDIARRSERVIRLADGMIQDG
ncbi:MAG: putative ABC transporter ATP-binding protein YknY [Firmicutes bacterium]|nr:putative ABC transporter ATP-binding protein YknY [Bacillota bacterium]MBT9152850.1 putative ABC transporter ATP-binding protein YknY [Bacillota bacterium]MBT9157138.1 putative ABC transporter ATP-binding protein YknY [Bacillota bacterium]